MSVVRALWTHMYVCLFTVPFSSSVFMCTTRNIRVLNLIFSQIAGVVTLRYAMDGLGFNLAEQLISRCVEYSVVTIREIIVIYKVCLVFVVTIF